MAHMTTFFILTHTYITSEKIAAVSMYLTALPGTSF